MKNKWKDFGKNWKFLDIYRCQDGTIAKDYIAENGDVIRVFPDGEYSYLGKLVEG
jgi:hypothetical protein